jgi:hypothetical protein
LFLHIRGNDTLSCPLIKIPADPVIFGGAVGGFYKFANTSYLIYYRSILQTADNAITFTKGV